MKHERAMELLAQIAEDRTQPAYARVNALRALLDHASAEEEHDKHGVAAARRLMRKIDGDNRQLDGLIAIVRDTAADQDERRRAGELAHAEIHRTKGQPSEPYALASWDCFDAMTGDFWWLDAQLRKRRFS